MKPLELWYFFSSSCSICEALWPKVEKLIKEHYPKLELKKLNASAHREIAGQHRMLTVPGILFFVEGREHFRANGLLSINELAKKIEPAYAAFY